MSKNGSVKEIVLADGSIFATTTSKNGEGGQIPSLEQLFSVVVGKTPDYCPGGFFADVWKQFDDDYIAYLITVEMEIAEETDREVNVYELMHLALHEGFVRGIDHIREMLGGVGSAIPKFVPGEEPVEKNYPLKIGLERYNIGGVSPRQCFYSFDRTNVQV